MVGEQFDHVRGTKMKDVSRMLMYSEAKILAEIAKCDLVCANCHANRTYMRNQRHTEGVVIFSVS